MFKQEKMLKQVKRQRGQGMTEYIVIVALIGLASILVFSYFGNAISGQAAQMTSQIAGNNTQTGQGQANTDAGNANTSLANQAGLDNYYDKNHSVSGGKP